MALKRREKILVLLVGVAAVIWIFDRFYYFPKSRQISLLKTEIKAADSTLNERSLLTTGVDAIEAEILRLEKALKMYSERTLKGEELKTFLTHLAEESEPSRLKVVSLVPQEERLAPPEGFDKTLRFPNRKVTVRMVLHSTYHKLEAYLKGIEDLPFFAQVEHLQIERTQEAGPLLKVTLGLTIYIAGDA